MTEQKDEYEIVNYRRIRDHLKTILEEETDENTRMAVLTNLDVELSDNVHHFITYGE